MKNLSNVDGKLTSGKNISSWYRLFEPPQTSVQLKEDLDTDVVIVGGGLAGLSVAYCLTQAGKKVVVIEDGTIGSGETGRTTAHLVTALDDRYYHFENVFGEEDTRLLAQSHTAAIDFVEQTIKKENIDCDFERVNGYLFLHPSDKPESLDKELAAAKRAGLDVWMLDVVPGIPNHGRCIRFANQAQFHPLKYLAGLCRAIQDKGGKIYCETHASNIHYKGIVTNLGFAVNAKHVVVATNAPVNDTYSMMLKQYAYRTYVVGALIKKGTLPKALWWDTGDHDINPEVPPYHYLRIDKYNDTYDILISGGEDHIVAGKNETVKEEEHFERLEAWTRKHFPIENIVYKWSGEVLEPMDGAAYIGRNPHDRNNVYIVTGDSGNGMTHCSLGGMIISDLILGKKNKFEEIYKPKRFTVNSSGPFFQMLKDDLINCLRKWFFSDTKELSSIEKGKAAIVKLEGQKCGAFRDDQGKLHIVSAECTHLKCMVKWNESETSWDCPCHGSRYTYKGKVINGPANRDLPAFSEPSSL